MAPSSTMIRSAATRRSLSPGGDIATGISIDSSLFPLPFGERELTEHAARLCIHFRAQPEQVAHGVDQVGTVHGVEVEIGDALVDEVEYLFGGDGGGDQLAGGGVIVEAVE